LSDLRSAFIKSNLEPEREGEKEGESPNEVRSFELDELNIQDSSMRRGFTYDSENARNFDQANVTKAKEGVKELLKDALDKAKRQSAEIRTHAQKEGHDEGYNEGFKKGEEAAKKEFSPFLETIQGLIADLTVFRKNMYDKGEREMIEMVVDLAKKVIHFEFSTRDDAVQEMIRLAVQSVLDRESMVIKINPADKGYAESFRPELHHLFSEIKNITFEAHSGVERGGCVVETNFGVVDARMDKLGEQMDRILNLAPPPPDELISASTLQEDSATGTEEEIAEEEPGETPAQDSATSTEEVAEEEQGETPAQENDPETESPEETN
jgi:flagellar biosynthesis/type III secretory pathway protein FliH